MPFSIKLKRPVLLSESPAVVPKKIKSQSASNAEPHTNNDENNGLDLDLLFDGDEDNDGLDNETLLRKKHIICLPKKALVEAIHQIPDIETDNCKKDSVSQLFQEDYSYLPLKSDSHARPLWVCQDGRIILEAFSTLHQQAEDFLITIAEPVSRPNYIQDYKLTAYSLYAAVAVGMDTKTILQVLERFSKVTLPRQVVAFIKECTFSYGKVKLVLKHNRYYIESAFPELLRKLLKDEIIRGAHHALLKQTQEALDPEQAALLKENLLKQEKITQPKDDNFGAIITLDQEDDTMEELGGESDYTQSFEIDKQLVEEVKKRCGELDYPLMEEYDFRNDALNASLDIDLSPRCVIRDYQEKCLSKMFGGNGGRARSGIIVLPTGAGKTLVGITAACTVKKSTLILCTNAISVDQWVNEFRNWSSIKEGQIAKFTADSKTKFTGDAGIVVSTYTMITHSGKRAWDTAKMIEFVNTTEWGLLILDEVHVVPANVFRKVLTTVAAHTKLGLTATLVREDDKIQDLNFLIGPKLYEANWMDLANRGHIAKVEATEIWCPMTGDFYKHYLANKPGKRRLLTILNPYKLMACQYLIQERERLGDKIIVFSDNVFALFHYARALKKPFIYGGTSYEERQKILHLFRTNHPQFRTIFLSKVGDTSLDLPEATCLIQVSSQFGSRRQEAQRMGRILRAKRRNEEGFKSRFYTLVSKDTDEVSFSVKRKRFLIDQGYAYKIISDISDFIPASGFQNLLYATKKEQQDLLVQVLEQTEDTGSDEVISTGIDDLHGALNKKERIKRNPDGSRAAPGMTAEEKAKREREKEKLKKRNTLFKKWSK